MLAEAKTVGMFGRGPAATADPPRITQAKDNGLNLTHTRPSEKTARSESAALPAAPKAEIVQEIMRADLHPFKDQPRKTFDQASLKELAESIKANGIVTPLLVRPRGTLITAAPVLHGFEIICGERRWRAAEMVGLSPLPCIVRTMNDKTALEIAGLENLQREGIPAYEEAVWIAKLIETGAHTVDSLALKLGKSRAFIFHRRSLARVSPPVLEALRQGEIEPTVAQLIGTIPDPKQQEKALENLTETFGQLSFDEAKQLIEQDYRKDLKGSCFDRDDGELLKGVPSCEECPKRSGNIAGYEGNNPNVCTDTQCYKRKVAAHVARKTAKLEAQGLKVLPASESKKMENRWSSTDFEPERAGYISEKKEVAKGKTIGDLLKNTTAQACVALDSKHHNAHVVFKVADVAPLLKEKGVTVKVPKPAHSYNSPEAEAERKRDEDERKARVDRLTNVANLAMPQLLAAVQKKPVKTFLLWMFDVGFDQYEMKQVFKERNIDRAKLPKKSEGELMALWLEFKAGCHMVYGYPGEFGREFAAACTAYGIDLKQIEKELAARKDVGRRFVDLHSRAAQEAASKAKAGKGARV